MGSLQDVLDSIGNPVEAFRQNDLDWQPYVFPDEYTNWIEEQRAVRESVTLVDQSYHMEILDITGPDAIQLLEELGVNSFEKIKREDPPQAIDHLVCNPNGYVIGDNILFYLGEEKFRMVGTETINNWIRFNAETSQKDVEAEVSYHPHDERDPPDFRFQVQGPHAMDVIKEVVDHPLPDIPFFQMDTIEINDTETFALAHGMAGFPGLEIFGPYEAHGDIFDEIMDAGSAYGIRQMGRKAYKTGKIGSGWLAWTVPAIYEHEDMEAYRKWLGDDSLEAQLSLGGSYVSNDIVDYYMTPFDRGQGHLIDFNHEFIGRKALEEKTGSTHRDLVTLEWDSDDVIEVYASLFGSGPTYKYLDMPDVPTRWSSYHYDIIKKDGAEVGLSKYPGYLYYEREMLSLAVIDSEYSEPGTEVSFIWGDDSTKRGVERHELVDIKATVAPAPYVQGGREDM